VPPLRDRVEDIPLLASYFLKVFTDQNGKSVRLAVDAIEAMKRYPWPGNVRELKNVLERAVTFNDTGVVRADELEFGEDASEMTPPAEASGRPPTVTAEARALDDMEKEHIIRILRETKGNKKKAAEILGIERRTLYNKAKRLGIDFGSL
jgi:DNA-binding NtrC family response regulator